MQPKFHAGRILAMASAVLLIIASCLPWSKVSILGMSESVFGIQGDGKIQIGIAVIVLVLLAIQKIKMWIPMIFAVIAGLVAAIDYNSIAGMNQEMDGVSEFAFGFYLIPLSILGVFAGCIWTILINRQSKPLPNAPACNIQSGAVS